MYRAYGQNTYTAYIHTHRAYIYIHTYRAYTYTYIQSIYTYIDTYENSRNENINTIFIRQFN